MNHYPTFPYEPGNCPGRPYHSSDNSMIGCALCGTLLMAPGDKPLDAWTVEELPLLIPCGAVRGIFVSRVRRACATAVRGEFSIKLNQGETSAQARPYFNDPFQQ